MQDEHRLEQRHVTHAPFRPQLFNELLERNILMRDRVDSRVAHTLKQFAERRIAAEIRPQGDRVHEQPD